MTAALHTQVWDVVLVHSEAVLDPAQLPARFVNLLGCQIYTAQKEKVGKVALSTFHWANLGRRHAKAERMLRRKVGVEGVPFGAWQRNNVHNSANSNIGSRKGARNRAPKRTAGC